MNGLLDTIDFVEEKGEIVEFLRGTFDKQGIGKAVIGLSGGIDSTVSFFLLKEVLAPEDIVVAHLYYGEPVFDQIKAVLQEAKIPEENIHLLSIKEPVAALERLMMIESEEENKMRIGNIAARMRMVVLFDLAKKYGALVCGTENKSENLLGYFTRFGDQASDIEPIEHLYKTQVFGLANYLGVPEAIIAQHPTAGLWAGQTDEEEMGFTYEEADQVLSYYFDQKKSIDDIISLGFISAQKVIDRCKMNQFKHEAPYRL